MYNVVIIDDEPIIRKGLIKKVDWEGMGCVVCGEAEDGVEGQALIREEKPDIIFTDICMREVDGLEMIKSVKDFIPNAKIIIISGYRNFEYAQEALELGAFCFICKPTKMDEINSALKRAVEQLRQENAKSSDIESLKAVFTESIPAIKQQILLDALYGRSSDWDLMADKMRMVGLDINRFWLIVAENDNKSQSGQSSDLDVCGGQMALFAVDGVIKKCFKNGFTTIMALINGIRAAFIVQCENDENVPCALILERCESVRVQIENQYDFTISIGISSEGNGIEDISDKFKECMRALEHKFYTGDNAIIPFWDINQLFIQGLLPALSPYKEALMEEISAGNKNAVSQTLTNLIDRIPSDTDNSVIEQIKSLYRNILTDMYGIRNCVIAAGDSKQANPPDVANLYQFIDKCVNIDELNKLLCEAAVSVTEKCNAYNSHRISLKIQKAMEYVREHYGEQLTLGEVADELGVSSYYLSRIFKKESGLNFVDYLTEIRMKKAKELLRQVEYKTYEVADLVGINDAFYFSKLFKKYTGMTPTEYKNASSANI